MWSPNASNWRWQPGGQVGMTLRLIREHNTFIYREGSLLCIYKSDTNTIPHLLINIAAPGFSLDHLDYAGFLSGYLNYAGFLSGYLESALFFVVIWTLLVLFLYIWNLFLFFLNISWNYWFSFWVARNCWFPFANCYTMRNEIKEFYTPFHIFLMALQCVVFEDPNVIYGYSNGFADLCFNCIITIIQGYLMHIKQCWTFFIKLWEVNLDPCYKKKL